MSDAQTELKPTAKKRTPRAKSSSGGGIVEALLNARRKITGYEKTGENEHRSSTYGTLQDMLSAIHPALYENGLIEEFSYALVDGAWHCFLTVIHAPTKESRQIFKPMIIETGGRINGEQAWASSSTYSRRYLLESFFGLCEGDDGDDGARSGMNSRERAQYTADMEELTRLRAENSNGRQEVQKLHDELRSLEAHATAKVRELSAQLAAATAKPGEANVPAGPRPGWASTAID